MDTKKVLKYMKHIAHDYIDECGEMNYTKLAEDTCESLDLYENESDIPEELFDLSVVAGDWHLAQKNSKENTLSAWGDIILNRKN